jgi:hypothetical protein
MPRRPQGWFGDPVRESAIRHIVLMARTCSDPGAIDPRFGFA